MDKYIEENEFNNQELIQIQNHSKLYEVESDKKEFLKKITPYEQKLILLNSSKPAEVLNYLDELNMENTKILLSELNSEEITRMLERFSSEDKQIFYKYFNDLELVNKFIKYDDNAKDHVKDLDFERKIEILDSSKQETIAATLKVYDSMSTQEQIKIEENLTNADSSVALETVSLDFIEENSIEENFNENNNVLEQPIKEVEQQEEEILIEENNKENQEQNDKNNDDEALQQKNEFYKKRLEYYIENIPQFKNAEKDSIIEYEVLSSELRSIVDNDFDSVLANNKVDLDNAIDVVDLFHESVKQQEMIEIDNIIKCVNQNSIEEPVLESQNSKSI